MMSCWEKKKNAVHNRPMMVVVVVALGVLYHKDDKVEKLLDIVAGLVGDPRHWLWYHRNQHYQYQLPTPLSSAVVVLGVIRHLTP